MRTVITTIANDNVVANRAAIAVAAGMGMGTVRVLDLPAPRLHQGPSHKFGRWQLGKSKPSCQESYSRQTDPSWLPGSESTPSRLGRPFGGLRGTA
jgi:hypothetical protein